MGFKKLKNPKKPSELTLLTFGLRFFNGKNSFFTKLFCIFALRKFKTKVFIFIKH